jgi:3-carboxy-cis,cis-muconate cycloisomerase
MSVSSFLFGDPDVSAHFSDSARVQAMLDVEVALVEAEAHAGLVPASAIEPIRRAATVEGLDLAGLARDAADAGNLAIPLVRALRSRVARLDARAADHVHVGATSQDIIDTGLVLQLRAALPALSAQVGRASASAARHAQRHRRTPMPGRTWLQQATPITFGLKAAGWLDALERGRAAIEARGRSAFVLQFGGASGTLAALGPAAPDVAKALGERLGLPVPALPWHSHRDRLIRFACELAVLAGTIGKVGRDLALLSQTEVAEASEAPAARRGESSSMPHKHNPVSAAVALSAALRAPGLVSSLLAGMTQEHERGLGGWQAEWDALPELMQVTAGAARAIAGALEYLVVDEARMAANLGATGGLILSEAVVVALAAHLGQTEARAVVDAACRRAAADKRPLVDVLSEDARVAGVLPPDAIRHALAPGNYLGQAEALVDRALTEWKRTRKADA